MTNVELKFNILKERLALCRIRMQYSFSALILLLLFTWGIASPFLKIEDPSELSNPSMEIRKFIYDDSKNLKSIWPILTIASVVIILNYLIISLIVNRLRYERILRKMETLKPDKPVRQRRTRFRR